MIDFDKNAGFGPDDALQTTEEIEAFEQSVTNIFAFITKHPLD